MYEVKTLDGHSFIIKRNKEQGHNRCVCVPPEKEARLAKIIDVESKLQTLYLFILAKGGKENLWTEAVKPIVQAGQPKPAKKKRIAWE